MNGPDGITENHRRAWDRLSRLHLASTGLPDRTTYHHDGEKPER
jgi:hypothetical protein